MRVAGSTAVVFGATGNVGHGVAHALLEAGARVLAPTRTEAGAAALRAAFAGITPVIGDVSDADGATALAARLIEQGPIDHVFVSLGPWWQGGPVAGQPPAEWSVVRGMLLDGHVHAAATLLPHLATRPAATYTLATGMGAHHVNPGTSLLFVATNGVLALSKVLRAEHAAGPVRVNEVLIRARVEKVPRPGVIPSADFGRRVLASLSGDGRGEVLEIGARG